MAAIAHPHPARTSHVGETDPIVEATGMVPMRPAGMMLMNTSRAVRSTSTAWRSAWETATS